MGDALEVARTSKKQILSSFEFESELIAVHEPGVGNNTLDIAKSLDSEDVPHAALTIELVNQRSVNEIPLEGDFAVHMGWDNLDFGAERSTERHAWVQNDGL